MSNAPITGGFCDPFTGGSGSSSEPPARSGPAWQPPATMSVTGGGVDPFTGSGKLGSWTGEMGKRQRGELAMGQGGELAMGSSAPQGQRVGCMHVHRRPTFHGSHTACNCATPGADCVHVYRPLAVHQPTPAAALAVPWWCHAQVAHPRRRHRHLRLLLPSLHSTTCLAPRRWAASCANSTLS